MKKKVLFFGLILSFAFLFIIFNSGFVSCFCPDCYSGGTECPSTCNCEDCSACACGYGEVCIDEECIPFVGGGGATSICSFYYYDTPDCDNSCYLLSHCREIVNYACLDIDCDMDTCWCNECGIEEPSGTYACVYPILRPETCLFSFKEDSDCDGFFDEEYYPVEECSVGDSCDEYSSIYPYATCEDTGIFNYCCVCDDPEPWVCTSSTTRQRTEYPCTGIIKCGEMNVSETCPAGQYCSDGDCESPLVSCSMPTNPYYRCEGESVTFSLDAYPEDATCYLYYLGGLNVQIPCSSTSYIQTYSDAGTIYPAYAMYVGGSLVGSAECGTLYVSDCGTDDPVISVYPASRDFGVVEISSYADRTFSVTNVGGGTLSGSASVTSPFNCVSGCSYSLGEGQNQVVTIRFSPTSEGPFSRTVSFTGGGGASATVTGTGLIPEAGSITVTNPIINEQWEIGTEESILWDDGGSISNVNILISRNGGGYWTPVFSGISNIGFALWEVTGPESLTSLIKVEDSSNPSVYGISENFLITGEEIPQECEGITICSDYETESYCDSNICEINVQGSLPGVNCSDPSINCACSWDDNECKTVWSYVPVDYCGDGVVNPGETCDGSDWGSITGCGDFDEFTGGDISCNSITCHFDTSLCTGGPGPGPCGNNIVNTGETCDGSDWGPIEGCENFDEFIGGDLDCGDDCLFDTSLCISPEGYCGDGIVNIGETCDGDEWGPITGCEDFDEFTGGDLDCNINCNFDTSLCTGGTSGVCDDGVVNTGETCDGSAWGSITGCGNFDEFIGGDLDCGDDCLFDTSLCTTPGTGIDVGTCVYTQYSEDDCDDGFLTFSWTVEWVWDEGCDLACQQENQNVTSGCVNGQSTVECPAQIPLPFFNIYSFISTLIIIALIYAVMIALKKKKLKSK